MKHIAGGAGVLGLLLLAGCAGGAAVGGLAAGTAAPAVITALGGASVLSDVAKAGCAAQAAANAGADIATATGQAAWAKRLSDASTIAGLACAW